MAVGQPAALFWELTPNEVEIVMRGAEACELRRSRDDQAIAYRLAQLIGFSVSAPKRMPKFDKAFPDPAKPRRVQSPEEMLEAMRMFTVQAGGMVH